MIYTRKTELQAVATPGTNFFGREGGGGGGIKRQTNSLLEA